MKRWIISVLTIAFLGSVGLAQNAVDFDGRAAKPGPQESRKDQFLRGLLGRPRPAEAASGPSLAQPGIDIVVERESDGPFARWRIRSGNVFFAVEKSPAGSYRVWGPGIELEIGATPGPFPNTYIRGNASALQGNPILMPVILRVVLDGRP